MKVTATTARARLHASDHGVLGTVHPERGVDEVPVCFAAAGDLIAIPIDRVKPKADAELQRVRNLRRDPRATLLCEHWEREDWSRLWWVRASLRRVDPSPPEREELVAALLAKYPQYSTSEEAIADIVVFRVESVTGWAAEE